MCCNCACCRVCIKGCNCLKGFYGFFNTVVFLVAVAMLIIAAWSFLLGEIKDYYEIMNAADNSRFRFWSISLAIFLAAACWVVLTSIIGFPGCCVESKGLYASYSVMIFIAVAALISAGALNVIFAQEISSKLRSELNQEVINKVKNGTNLGKAWDGIQIMHKCCGNEGYLQYNNSTFHQTSRQPVPDSCCARVKPVDDPSQIVDLVACRAEATAGNSTDDQYLNRKGCYDDINRRLATHNGVLLGLSFAQAGLLIIGFGLSVGLCSRVGKHGDWSLKLSGKLFHQKLWGDPILT